MSANVQKWVVPIFLRNPINTPYDPIGSPYTSQTSTFWAQFWADISWPNFGPTFWAQFWADFLGPILGRLSGPNFGPTFWVQFWANFLGPILGRLSGPNFGPTFWAQFWPNFLGPLSGPNFWANFLGCTPKQQKTHPHSHTAKVHFFIRNYLKIQTFQKICMILPLYLM